MNHSSGTEIAIIGMAGRFPGAADVDTFWRNICNRVESVTWFSEAELRRRGVSDAMLDDAAYVRAGVVLEGMDQFDAAFFAYAPRDAEHLDPQQRIFLETAWHALEHAGYAGTCRPELIGIYAGSGANLYLMRHLLPTVDWQTGDVSTLIGLLSSNDKDTLATRVAYKLDLRGPAVSVQTACSTSLTAVHFACRGLLYHETDLALAGGVSLNLLQTAGYRYQQGAILSADGHCRAFDAKATGTLVGSGAGVVVLKRLADAEADRDTIYAVIKGSAINNDGADKVGFTAPSVAGQTDVILAAQAMADVTPDSIGYVEAHGTGTTLGDPIEMAALTQAFCTGTQRRNFCAVGSVKTNVGHLDAAAGVTGLIKTALALYHHTLPPSLNFDQPNPQIELAASPFFINTETRSWPTTPTPRRAGVSSFGMGGTNVHVVLEEAAPTEPVQVHQPQLLLLSARSDAALQVATDQLADHIERHPQQSLADIAHTLRVGRKHFEHRCAALAGSRADAIQKLRHRPLHDFHSGQAMSANLPVAFLFPGQGSQHPGMAQALCEQEPGFREVLDRCCDLFDPHLTESLGDLLRAAPGDVATSERLQRTEFTQPALFAVEYALAQWWMSIGLRPAAMLGHSVGEYVAACLAGVFSLEDAVAVVAARGRLMQSTQAGAMLAVNLSATDIRSYLSAGCDLAAVNAADSCVLSGTSAAIEAVEGDLQVRGVFHQRLHVSRGFHSALLDPVLDDFKALLAGVQLRTPEIPFISNLTGTWITPQQACDPAYWMNHLRHTVRFEEGVGELLSAGHQLLEVGPGETLSGLARRHPLANRQQLIASSQCSPSRIEMNATQPARCVAALWVAGIEIDEAYFAMAQGRRVALPLYPFERQSYWVHAQQRKVAAASALGVRDIWDWFYVPTWQRAAPVSMRDTDSLAGATLLLSDAHAFVDALSDQLHAMNGRVVRVERGDGFRRLDEHRYVVRPDDERDLAQLVRSIQKDIGAISNVWHFWSLTTNDDPLELNEVLERGFHSLLALAHVLSESSARKKISMLVVTDQLEDVAGTESLCAEKATLHGACKVIPQEYENIDCRLIDIAPPLETAANIRLAQKIAAEIHAPAAESVVAYRGTHRWIRSFSPVRLDSPVTQRLRRRGVYVITGGLGGIGLTLSKHLVANWQARVALISRTALPDRKDWSALSMSVDQPEHLRWKLGNLLELERQGAEIMVLNADVSDEAQLHAAIGQVLHRFSTINGVVHAAGERGTGLIGNRDREAMRKVMRPKVQGAVALMKALECVSPDFILLCSSLAAVTGGIGRADYSAANCFLDAIAARESRHSGRFVLSVNWDGWRDVGMAASQAFPDGVGISSAQGGALLEALLSGAHSEQILVSTVDLDRRVAMANFNGLDDLSRADALQKKTHKHARPAISVSYVEPVGALESGLTEVWEDFLGITPVGVNDSLFELGGDSLLAIQLLGQIQKKYGTELHPASFMRSPTISSLAALVEERLIEEIETTMPPARPEAVVAMMS